MNKYEELTKTFLRLNGYFTIDNFIVHNGDADISNSYKKVIPQSTEIDILAVRFPFQKEQSGKLLIVNDRNLILKKDLIDLVIVESKSQNENKPNSTFTIKNIKYILHFFGFTDDENYIDTISNELYEKYSSIWQNYSIRYIITSETINKHYADKGLQYILIDDIIDFIIHIRSECWFNEGMGVSSYHKQWNCFMNDVFKILNQATLTPEEKKLQIKDYLEH